ncbi:V-type proton ATPase subunit S1-like [Tachyglossus aculeatus]|uniref:V-type proton ATPase subunit S1-like n=1 Tax=Tachyglossus aculeatus TaxID=9261 RepID=UPI0018F390C6|nr:V-type proton ATPase subunit S1-like [Tachyglossus aculeatus]
MTGRHKTRQSSLWPLQPAFHEGHIISKQELHLFLKPAITQHSQNLVLFLQDELSVDDLTYFSNDCESEGSLSNIQEILSTSASALVLPSVDSKAISHVMDHLPKMAHWKLTHIEGFNLSHLEVDTRKPNLVIVTLQPVKRGTTTPYQFPIIPATTMEMLDSPKGTEMEGGWRLKQKNGGHKGIRTSNQLIGHQPIQEKRSTSVNSLKYRVIRRLTTILQDQGAPFSAIYTAVRSSRIPRRPSVKVQSRRQLLEVGAEQKVPYPLLSVTDGITTCILFFASRITLVMNHSLRVELTNLTFISQKVNLNASMCSTNQTMLSLKYTEPTEGVNSLEIQFKMTSKFYASSARKWFTLDSVEILQDNRETAQFKASIISAPVEYSFHCQLVGTSPRHGAWLIPSNNEARSWDIVISEFQIQAFGVQNNLFPCASDCTAFFSPGIWMGLVVSIVFLWILIYGIHMILQLTTSSRFDNPRDNPLSIPHAE